MAEQPLKREDGLITIEFMLLLPWLLVVLVALWQVDASMRAVWGAQMEARVAAWALQRNYALPASADLLAQARQMDGRTAEILVEEANASSPAEVEGTFATLRALALVGAAAPGDYATAPDYGARVSSGLNGAIGRARQDCYLWAETWEAQAARGDDSFRAFLAIRAAPAWTAATVAGATCLGRMKVCGNCMSR